MVHVFWVFLCSPLELGLPSNVGYHQKDYSQRNLISPTVKQVVRAKLLPSLLHLSHVNDTFCLSVGKDLSPKPPFHIGSEQCFMKRLP